MSPSALDGLRVLDLTRLLPGPLATWMLAELGAEVIKVEDPAGGDPTRRLPPFDRSGAGCLFSLLNRSKRSLALDLKQPAGREIFLRLACRADLVVEGFRPGVMERLGLSYADLRESRADLILCSISGYGQTGPLSRRAGHDLNFQALAGLLSQQGPADQAPAMPAVPVADLLGGCWQGLAAIFGALYQREKTGRGQWLDVAMCDGALSSLVMPLANLAAGQPLPARGRGPLTGALPAYGIFACADGRHLAVAAIEPQFFDPLCRLLGLDQHVGRAGAQGEEARRIRAAIAARLAEEDLASWLARFEPQETCTEAVMPVESLPAQAQFSARGLFRPGPAGPHLTCPLRLDGDLRPESPAPALGADSEAILREAGLAPERIRILARDRVLRLG